MTPEKTYLGDSVYCSFEGEFFTLTTENGMGATNTIHIEPEVLKNLLNYTTQIGAREREVKKKKTKPPKIRRLKLVNSVYPYVLFVIAGGERGAAKSWFEKKFSIPVKERTLAYGTTFTKEGELSHLIWFSSLKPSASTIAHEAVHSVRHALFTVGEEPLCHQNEEAYAYLLSWTVNEISRKLW